jgi:hypothetical protein
MSVAESGKIGGILDQLKTWPSSERLRLARMILESLEGTLPEVPSPARSLKDILGMLKTDAPPPSDEECRTLLEDELIKKHLR